VNGGNFLTMWTLSGNPGSSTLTAYNIPVTAYTTPPDVAQPDATLLDAGDCRVLDAVYGFGRLYETHNERFAGQPVVTVSSTDVFNLDHHGWHDVVAVGDATAFGAIDVDDNDEVARRLQRVGKRQVPGARLQASTIPVASRPRRRRSSLRSGQLQLGSAALPMGPIFGLRP
jgi:hypothetical protein